MPVLESLFNKVAGPEGQQLYQKETPTQMFSGEYCKMFKSTYLEEHLPMVPSTSSTFF